MSRFAAYIFVCVVFNAVNCINPTTAAIQQDIEEMSSEEKLYGFIFRRYTKAVRPVKRPSETVNVNISFSLMQIHSLDEKTQVFRTYGMVVVDWIDKRLAWPVEEFENITEFIVNGKQVWTPELAIINEIQFQFPKFDEYNVVIQHDGSIRWEPAGYFETSCEIDITFYPYDSQTCNLHFGTWTYPTHKVNFTESTNTVMLDSYMTNGVWRIMSTKVDRLEFYYDCCPTHRLSLVSAQIHMKRMHRFFTMNLVLPFAMLSSLTLVTFLSPPDQGEKLSLGITTLLSFSVFMLSLSENMPKTSATLPLFGIFTTYVMLMNTISVMLTVFVLNLHNRHSNKPVPYWVRRCIFGGLGRMLCLENSDIHDNHNINDAEKNANEWRELARVMDRLFFWFTLLAMVLFSAAVFI